MSDSMTSYPDEITTADRSESSKLRESIKQYGTNSYYYAHSRSSHVPADAIVREGEGVVTGGQPVLIASTPAPLTKPKRKITAFAWFDDNDRVKVYLEDPAFLAQADGLTHEFTPNSCRFETPDAFFALDNLDDAIDVAASSFRLSATRLTIVLKKINTKKTWYSIKTK